jgi:S-adenosylmethionine:tRNA ribosyltransferase-isomerase
MRTSDFHFELPTELIAQTPPSRRSASRLMHLDPKGQIEHLQFEDFPRLISSNDLLVFNDTRVVPARFLGHKLSGGQVEVLIERLLTSSRALAHVRASKRCRPGSEILLEQDIRVRVVGRDDSLYIIELIEHDDFLQLMERRGRTPLPPYITRPPNEADRSRYQTVYARYPGAVAAPTAGLHFDHAMLERLQASGTQLGWITLHVGAGTFQPVRTEDPRRHKMHSERIQVSELLAEQLTETRRNGGRVIAVGTTVVRTLESVADESGVVSAFQGETDIFISPGHRFKVVDAMLTNFHLPESTLLMLVSAFAGREPVMKAYGDAVSEQYRFFSYGDAMFIESPVTTHAGQQL